MKRFQPQENQDTDLNVTSVPNLVSASGQNSKRKRMTITRKQKQTKEKKAEKDSDFKDEKDEEEISRAKSEYENGSNLSVNVDSSGYNLRSTNPPESVPMVDEDSVKNKDKEDQGNLNKRPSRLQQPPAHVNKNLAKIKLESDYVPIVEVKQEVVKVEEIQVKSEISTADNYLIDENEQTEINSSSVSTSAPFQSNSSSSTNKIHELEKLQPTLNKENESEIVSNPHEPEVEHPFNCLQISRVKSEDSEIEQEDQEEEKEEKVVVKVEADVSNSVAIETSESENETEKKEQEKEAVGKLEERIQKYVQKVASLQREKMEIKTSLQREIAQLNLVIEEQETKIQELNLSSTLQRGENQELKSHVAKYEKQIEKFKNKLKSSIRIQQAIENSSLKTGRKANPKPNKNPNPVGIEALPSKALSRIFDYLDINSLKESRFVCHRWRCEAGIILLKNFYLVCDERKRCENTLKKWLTNSNSKSRSKSAATSTSTENPTAQKFLSVHAKNSLKLLKKSAWLQTSIRELKYEQWDTENLYQVLLLLPNLQVLETRTLDLSPQQNWLTSRNFGGCRQGIPIELERLLKKLEMLKELKLDFGMTRVAAQHFFSHDLEPPSESIRNLELHAASMSVMRNFITPILNNKNNNSNWTITRFTWDVAIIDNVLLIRNFLSAVAPTLKHLKLIWKIPPPSQFLSTATSGSESKSLPISIVKPWTDDWLIPLGLNRVETMKIERAVAKEKHHFVVKFIVVALQLPRLKKLSVGFIPKELEEIIYKWNSHESANGRKLQSQSLEELEISPHFPKLAKSSAVSQFKVHQFKISGNPWPQLKSLKCGWKNPETFDASFLSELGNLERLELWILKWNPEESQMSGRNDREKCIEFRLRDLKKLTRFCLKAPANGQQYQDFTNSLVDKDLKFMKNLQSVQFNCTVIDVATVKSEI